MTGFFSAEAFEWAFLPFAGALIAVLARYLAKRPAARTTRTRFTPEHLAVGFELHIAAWVFLLGTASRDSLAAVLALREPALSATLRADLLDRLSAPVVLTIPFVFLLLMLICFERELFGPWRRGRKDRLRWVGAVLQVAVGAAAIPLLVFA